MIKFEIYANDTVNALQDLRTLGRLAETYLQGRVNSPAEPYVGETPFPSTPADLGSPETPKAQSGKDNGNASKAPSGTKEVTPEEARTRGKAAAKKYGKETVKAILASLNVSSLSNLTKADERAAFIAELDKLDAEKGGEADT